MKANWKRSWKFGCEIPPGSFATGELSAAEQLGISGSKWRRLIKKLKEYGMIDVRATNRFTVISLVKWQGYQEDRRTDDERPTNDRRATDEPPTTIEERKKERKEEFSPPLTREAKNRKQLSDPHPEWADQWKVWLDSWLSRCDRQLDPVQAEAQLKELHASGPAKAEADLMLSINRYAKRILDSNNDFDKRSSRQSGNGKAKCKLDFGT